MSSMENGKPRDLNDADFENEVLASDGIHVVDFWAPWCGPCRMVSPVLEALAKEFDGRAKFAKVNTDDNPDLTTRYGIMSIPTVMIFKAGKPVDQIVGAAPAQVFRKRIEAAL